ncbi:hypothetical protein ACMFMF_005130 [Clarireedia jacksonii]
MKNDVVARSLSSHFVGRRTRYFVERTRNQGRSQVGNGPDPSDDRLDLDSYESEEGKRQKEASSKRSIIDKDYLYCFGGGGGRGGRGGSDILVFGRLRLDELVADLLYDIVPIDAIRLHTLLRCSTRNAPVDWLIS